MNARTGEPFVNMAHPKTRLDRDADLLRVRYAEKVRIWRHMPDCYGAPNTCMSCGCQRSEGKPCISHAYIVAWAKYPISEARVPEEK